MTIIKKNFLSKIKFQKIRKLFFILLSFDIKLIYSLFNNIPAGTEHLKFFSNIKKLNTIVDIGCHKGQFALISKYIYKKSKIFSFDPLKSSQKKYKSILKKKDGYHFFNNAIGNKDAIAKINISKKSDSSSLLEITDKQTSIFKNTEKIKEEKIYIKKLNSCLKKKDLQKPCLLKIDVQGYELEVLKGCQELLNCFDFIYIECSFVELYKKQPLYNEVNTWLKKRNFKYVKKFNTSFDNNNKIIQADFFFKKLS